MIKVGKAEPEVEAVTSLFFPQAVALERGAFALLGLAALAVTETRDAVTANGLNIALDQQLIADIKALIQAIQQYAKAVGMAKPAGAVTSKQGAENYRAPEIAAGAPHEHGRTGNVRLHRRQTSSLQFSSDFLTTSMN